ncbi:MAG: hypothetical protein RI955_1528 [Bacteroidota bacterium]
MIPQTAPQFSIDSFPADARVWIYQADRNLNEYEVLQCKQTLQSFSQQWTSHQMPLKAATEVLYNRFVVFYVDESANEVSGCGIDKSVNLVKQIEQQLGVDFFNRTQITYQTNDEVKAFALADAKKLFTENVINANTIIFNNLVNTKHELDTEWKQQLAESWLWKRISIN